jgi:AcrR family transcriptional regulator
VASKRITDAPLRRDAEHNRQRLLKAARDIFAERGIDTPLEDIARRAGVGIATLYRRFPTREALIEAIFEEKAMEYVRAADEALNADDPWDGFRTYIERICAMQATDRGFTDVLTTTFPTAKALEAWRREGHKKASEVIRRAQEQGRLRDDFGSGDLIFILIANGAFLQATRDVAPNAWKRYVALLLDALRAGDTTPLPPPPTDRELYRAMLAVSPRGRKDR